MEKLEKKIQFGLSVVICALAVTMATAQTIMMEGWHPAVLIFWAMVFVSLLLVRVTYKELKNKHYEH